MRGAHLTPSSACRPCGTVISLRCDRQRAWLCVGDGSLTRAVSRARRWRSGWKRGCRPACWPPCRPGRTCSSPWSVRRIASFPPLQWSGSSISTTVAGERGTGKAVSSYPRGIDEVVQGLIAPPLDRTRHDVTTTRRGNRTAHKPDRTRGQPESRERGSAR